MATYYLGSHKNGCKYRLSVSTAWDGRVTVKRLGEHEATCGDHPERRRLAPQVKTWAVEGFRRGASTEHMHQALHDPESLPLGAMGGCRGWAVGSVWAADAGQIVGVCDGCSLLLLRCCCIRRGRVNQSIHPHPMRRH